MLYGTIVQYFEEKKFGFIRPDVGPDVFFHLSAVGACTPPKRIKVGQPVKFELKPPTEQPERMTRMEREEAAAAKSTPEPRAQAKLVELIDKIPGATLDDVATRERPRRHPRARQKKPTWRR